MNDNRPDVLDRAALDQVAAEAMADRAVDLQAVWALAAQGPRLRRRRRARVLALGFAAAAASVAALLLLAVLAPGLRLTHPQPADVPRGPGAIPSRVGVAPPWTPVVTQRPIGRVALVLGLSAMATESGRNLPPKPVLVGADRAGGGDQYRLLPEGSPDDPVVAVSPDGSLVAWRRPTRLGEGTPGRVAVLRASTGRIGTVELPGTWRRGVNVSALAFTGEGAALRIRGRDELGYYSVGGVDSVWSVEFEDGVPGPLRGCTCLPDDVPQLTYYDGNPETDPLTRLTQVPRYVRVVAVASSMATTQRGPEAVPGQARHDADWYPWIARQAVDWLGEHWKAILACLVLVVGFTLRRRGVTPPPPDSESLPSSELFTATARWGARVGLAVIALALVGAVVLTVVAAAGLGLPEPASHAGGGAVVPRTITAVPSRLEPAFSTEGKPGTTRVSMVTRTPDGVLAGLDAATGSWVSLSDVPGMELGYDMSLYPLTVSPNGRYVLRAASIEGEPREHTVVVDLQEARVHRVDLPFGSDPAWERNSSLDTAAVLDDGTVAIVRANLGALWLVSLSGEQREITSLGDVRAVAAQPGPWLLVLRPRVGDDTPRIDLLDARTGRVRTAATDLGGPSVVATVGDAEHLAWQGQETGLRAVGLPDARGKTAQEGLWSAPGGVEALWPSAQGTLVGVGWSDLAPDTLLRASPGTTSLQPFAVFGPGPDERVMTVSVAGSVVAAADVVAPAKRPWWGRAAWSVIDRF